MSGSEGEPTGFGPIAFIGFGEAAQAFVSGWQAAGLTPEIRAYDIKTDSATAAVSSGKWADYDKAGVTGCASTAEAVADAKIIFSTVTADQAFVAAGAVAETALDALLYFDCNSCAPGTKRKSAGLIETAGGRYVDTAVMAPVHPRLHKTPILLAGPHAKAGLAAMNSLDMAANPVDGNIGAASAIKMTRSIMVKGLEALTLECVLAGRAAGVEDIVLDSLEKSYPGFGWTERAAYMMERVMTHGIRRAAEMREVALTVAELGLDPLMSTATAQRQDEVGQLRLDATEIGENDYGKLADAILQRLVATADDQDNAVDQSGVKAIEPIK